MPLQLLNTPLCNGSLLGMYSSALHIPYSNLHVYTANIKHNSHIYSQI